MTETEQAQALLNYLSSNVLRRPGIQLTGDSSLVASGLIDSFALVDAHQTGSSDRVAHTGRKGYRQGHGYSQLDAGYGKARQEARQQSDQPNKLLPFRCAGRGCDDGQTPHATAGDAGCKLPVLLHVGADLPRYPRV